MLNFKKILTLLLLVLWNPLNSYCQNSNTNLFESSGKIMVVIAVIAIIFIGIVVFLFSMERRLNKLEKEIINK